MIGDPEGKHDRTPGRLVGIVVRSGTLMQPCFKLDYCRLTSIKNMYKPMCNSVKLGALCENLTMGQLDQWGTDLHSE